MSWFSGSNDGVDDEQIRFENKINELQRDDSIRSYNILVERCFFTCVHNFRTSKLDKTEELCVYRCVEKFLRHTSRVSRAFQEQTAAMEAEVRAGGQVDLSRSD